ncbi:MAG: hypothetical protein HYS27_20830 [Deltaproteobacteria bacterium]|nr:hypothetical protein [Deltaproteobacteria bacterium]
MKQRSLLLAATAAAILAGSACHHLTTKVPGVLDMRTDGSGAGPATRKAGAGERTGFDGLMLGEGVTGSSELKVVDRKYWVCSFFPIINDSATEEIQLAVGSEALKNCRIGQQFTIMNWLTSVVVQAVPVVNVLGIIMPPQDFHFWGTPVKAGGDVALPPPDAPPDAPPPPDGAVVPTPAPAPGN